MWKKVKVIIVSLASAFMLTIAVLAVLHIIYTPAPAIPIGENVVTIKQLVKYTDEYVREYGNHKDAYLSDIVMHVNENHRGKIILTYSYKSKGRVYRYSVEIDTEEHMINSMDLNSTIPASTRDMNFPRWVIDSDEAVDIAFRALQKEGYVIDNSWTRIDASGENQNCKWGILFRNEAYLELFGQNPHVIVDAFTGEVSSQHLSFGSK